MLSNGPTPLCLRWSVSQSKGTTPQWACDHTSGIGGEMDCIGQNGNVELVLVVAAGCDVAGSDHKPAARFAWYTFCA